MNRSLALIVAVGVTTACTTAPTPTCTALTAIHVSAGTSPTVTWSPDCAIGSIQVAKQFGGDVMWHAFGARNAQDIPSNTLRSGIRYGTLPAGATQLGPAQALSVDTSYSVLVEAYDPQGPVTFFAGTDFTP